MERLTLLDEVQSIFMSFRRSYCRTSSLKCYLGAERPVIGSCDLSKKGHLMKVREDSLGATKHKKMTSASLLPRACLKSEFFSAAHMFGNPSLMRFLNAATKIYNEEMSTWVYVLENRMGAVNRRTDERYV